VGRRRDIFFDYLTENNFLKEVVILKDKKKAEEAKRFNSQLLLVEK